MNLIERLRDHARSVGGDTSFERLYGNEACEAADALEALRGFVQHKSGPLCMRRYYRDEPCTCGLDALIAKLGEK